MSECITFEILRQALYEASTKYDFEKLYLLGSSDYSITPCFLCRQLIIEFFEKNKKVISFSKDGKSKEYKISELCPHAFTERELKND